MDVSPQSILRDARERCVARTLMGSARGASSHPCPKFCPEIVESQMSHPRRRRDQRPRFDYTPSYRSPSMPRPGGHSEPPQWTADLRKPVRPAGHDESSGSDPLGRALFNFDGCTYLVTFPKSDPNDATFVELDELPWFEGEPPKDA